MTPTATSAPDAAPAHRARGRARAGRADRPAAGLAVAQARLPGQPGGLRGALPPRLEPDRQPRLDRRRRLRDDLELEVLNVLRRKLSPLAMPQEIECTASLPKTRSGKIVRRVLRAREFDEPLGDLFTLMEE